jgi:ribosome-binding factor A
MTHYAGKSVKFAQKETQLLREFSLIYMQLCMDEPSLATLIVGRVGLSQDKGIATIFFHSALGEEDYLEKRKTLVLYKPSIRSALAKGIRGRYTPQLIFRYERNYAKQKRLEELLDSVKERP